jgi:hypothetical protein
MLNLNQLDILPKKAPTPLIAEPIKPLTPTEKWNQYCKENPGAEECRIYDV